MRNEQINASAERPHNHTGARKHETGNDDLSHVMPPGANCSSPPKKKKLTLHAVSNTQPLRGDSPTEASKEGNVKIINQNDRRLV